MLMSINRAVLFAMLVGGISASEVKTYVRKSTEPGVASFAEVEVEVDSAGERRLQTPAGFAMYSDGGPCLDTIGREYDYTAYVPKYNVAAAETMTITQLYKLCSESLGSFNPVSLVGMELNNLARTQILAADAPKSKCLFDNYRADGTIPCPSKTTTLFTDYPCVEKDEGLSARCIPVKDGNIQGSNLKCYYKTGSDTYVCPPECFSTSSTVMVKDRGTVQLKDVQVGEEVLTSGNKYERIYAFAHYHPTKESKFLKIESDAGKTIELTPAHLLYVDGKTHPIPASTIQVGDKLPNNEVVTKVTPIQKDGLAAPVTPSGTIIVDGFVASTHHTVMPEQTDYLELFGIPIIDHHSLVNLLIAPYKLVCTATSVCMNESYDENGLSNFAAIAVGIREMNIDNGSEWFKTMTFFLLGMIVVPASVLSNIIYYIMQQMTVGVSIVTVVGAGSAMIYNKMNAGMVKK